jgi:CheY-like chemotaxis protein
MRNLFSRAEESVSGSIFVLTNEESIIQKIVGVLQTAGYQVQSATNAQVAMDLLDKPPFPDLLILDLMMPDMDTATFLGTLRQRFGRVDLAPVLLLASDKEGEGIANELQVQDYLQKPFESADLLTHVQQLLERQEGS